MTMVREEEIDSEQIYGVSGDADTGILLMYDHVPKGVNLSGRNSVLATDYGEEGVHRTSKRDLIDITSHEEFEGELEDARELLDPPTADLLQSYSPPERLEEFKSDSRHDSHVVRFYSTPGDTDPDLLRHLENDDSFTMVNPLEAREAAAFKDKTHEILSESGIPTIPSLDAKEAVDRGESYTVNNIGGLDGGYILKSANSSGGNNQWRAENWSELLDIYDEKNIDETRGDYLVQPFIPHDESRRWMTYGTEVETGMIRRSEDDYRTNASDGHTTEKGAIKAIQEGRIDTLLPSDQPGIKLAEDASGELAKRFADPELRKPNIITSVDIMVTDRQDLEGLPDEYLDAVDEYRENGEARLVTEFESVPGERMDHMYMWSNHEERTPALREAVFLEELAGKDVPEPEDIAGDIQDRIWARVRSNYRSPERILSEKMVEEINRKKNKDKSQISSVTGP